MFQLRIVGLFSLMVILTGCVTGTRVIELAAPNYPDSNIASGEFYIGTIQDNRIFEQRPSDPSTPSVKGSLEAMPQETLVTLIGRQRNGYGKAMGDVALPEGSTILEQTRELLTEGLQSRGYTVTNDQAAPNKVNVSVDRFWGWFTPGMWAVSFQTQIDTTLNITTPLGEQTIDVKGHGINRGQIASDANWRLAFDRGFADFLDKLDAALEMAGL